MMRRNVQHLALLPNIAAPTQLATNVTLVLCGTQVMHNLQEFKFLKLVKFATIFIIIFLTLFYFFLGKSDHGRVKPLLDKKDTLHPPVSYRPVSRTGARSRDPSPIDKSEKTSSSTSSTSYNMNRLYPRPYTLSASRERLDSGSSTTTIPKYTGRSSISKEDLIPKYTGRSSITKDDSVSKYSSRSSSSKDDVPKYIGKASTSKDESLSRYKGSARASREDLQKYGSRPSKDDTPKYLSRSSTSKDEATSRYKTNRATSREDLSSQKYINSRFLPKNSVEKSYTAYTRPSTIRVNETSRRNKELLSVLHAQQEQERLSRPTSRCSSATPEDILHRELPKPEHQPSPKPEELEMETVTVTTRGTSPSHSPTPSNFLRSRRIEVAKVIEKQITRPKIRRNMVDKEIQSDRLDDSTKSSRFAGASRISATPWSSILDMKFSSPVTKQKDSKQGECADSEHSEDRVRKSSCDSPKSISRASSTKSVSQGSSKSDGKPKDKKSPSPSSSKSKLTPPKQTHVTDKKQLPPQIPKNEVSNKNQSIHSTNLQNKDFRKSVLNMNPEGKGKKKLGRRSNSASSADSDQSAADPEATDVSENLATCASYHSNSIPSKLPQKVSSLVQRSRRSPSSDTSSSSSSTGSEDDSKQKNKNHHSACSSRTSVVLSSADELSTDKSRRTPHSPKPKENIKPETVEAKSFLMRALAPVTSLFKGKHQEPERTVQNMGQEKVQSNAQHPVEIPVAKPRHAKLMLVKVEPGESTWCVEKPSSHSASLNSDEAHPKKLQTSDAKPFLRHVESGEIPWWLDEKSEIPEGVDTYPNYVREDGTTADGTIIFKVRHNDSDDSSWWMDGSEKSKSDSNNIKNVNVEGKTEDGRILYKVRHNESDESSWWLDSSEKSKSDSNKQNVPSNYVQIEGTTDDGRVIYKVRHNDSDESSWWLDNDKSRSDSGKRNVIPINLYQNEDGRIVYKIRHNDSDDTSWWLDSSDKTDSNKQNIMNNDYLEQHKIRHIDSGERAWWLNSAENIPEMVQLQEEQENKSKYAIRHQDSGEKPWWLGNPEKAESDNESENEVPLGDRASPEGLEMPKDQGRLSPYDNVPVMVDKNKKRNMNLFISKHTNIDDILGGTAQLWSPVMDKMFSYDGKPDECTEIDPRQVIIHENSPQRGVIHPNRM